MPLGSTPRRRSPRPAFARPETFLYSYTAQPLTAVSSASMATTKAIELKTAIPGPRSKEILERKERVVADPLSIFLPIVIERGDGATITDVDGNTFIDFTGGVGCL